MIRGAMSQDPQNSVAPTDVGADVKSKQGETESSKEESPDGGGERA